MGRLYHRQTSINELRLTAYQFQGEVTRYWETHFETDSRQILRPEYAANMAIHKPYKWAHLSPNAIDTAIAVIRSQAGPGSRQLYDRGDSTDSRVHNWVLKWLLWHVCRYRDWRNRKNRSTSASAATASHLGGGPGYGPGPAGGSAGNASGKIILRATFCEREHGAEALTSGMPPDYPSLPPHDYWATVLN